MEGAFECDDADAVFLTAYIVIAPRGLDGAFQRFGARIGEEDLVGESRFHQPLAQPVLARNFIEVGNVPESARLVRESGNQMRMGVAQRVHGYARGEVQIS